MATVRLVQSTADVPFSSLTTFRVGGPARELIDATNDDDVIAALREAKNDGTPTLVIAGGSNLLVGDSGFDGRVVRIASRGVIVSVEGDDVLVDVQAGEPWDELVARMVADGFSGFECLSGIPGSTGATPVQNVGAYGVEISSTFVSASAYDREVDSVVTLSSEDLNFAYRTSALKRRDRLVILSVRFRLARSARSVPITYAELARTLDVEAGATAPLIDVRTAVLGLRRGKGMVLDPSDTDTYSAGSFFTNPILDDDQFAGLCAKGATPPHWVGDGHVKVSAGWLIENSGFHKGFASGPARLSAKHVLALTNHDHARADDVIALARRVRSGVREHFGVELHVEPVLVGVEL